MPSKTKKSTKSSSGSQRPIVNVVSRRPLTIVRVPRSISTLFADQYEATGMTVSTAATGSATGISYQYKLGDPLNLFGPRVDYAGAFAANVPSGMNCLVSSNIAAGSAAPYKHCLSLTTEIEVSCYGLATNTIPTQLSIIFDTLVGNTSGMATAHIAEQPFSVHKVLPAVLTTPSVLKMAVNHWDVLGVTEKVYRESPADFASAVGFSPGNIVYATILTRVLDGATARSDFLEIKFRTRYLFTSRNSSATTVPTVSEPEPEHGFVSVSPDRPNGPVPGLGPSYGTRPIALPPTPHRGW